MMDADLRTTYIALAFSLLVIFGIIYLSSCTHSITQVHIERQYEDSLGEINSTIQRFKLPENALF